MDVLNISIALVGGLIAGVINVLAGNGSAITLLILTELLGLPPNVANGSNRLGVFSGSATAAGIFYNKGQLKVFSNFHIVLPAFIGAAIGVWTATQVSNEQFLWVFKIMLVVMLLVILINPKRWLIKTDIAKKVSPFLLWPLFLGIGFYGGFIQMGMGIIFLAAMVLGAKYSIIDANVIKTWIVSLYTLLCIVIFQYKGLISWPEGLVLAIGQSVGGIIAANFAVSHPKANLWAYRLLVVIVLWAILRLFGFFSWVLQLI